MPNRAVQRRLIRLLGSLPLIAAYANRLSIRSVVERHAPSRSNAHLTHGQVALAIIANRLTQPKAMYQLLSWAKRWAVHEVFDIDPDFLNDDRLGRCLEALAPHIDRIQGEVALAAVREFDLSLASVHWDLTSIVLQGEYPSEEQQSGYPKPAHGFGGVPGCKQLRVGEVVTGDGGVPLWHHTYDGNQADVGTVVQQMEALRHHLELPNCLVIGDTKLLSADVIGKLQKQRFHFLAPLPASSQLDREYLALPKEQFVPLEYVAQSHERRPPEERPTYQGQEVAWDFLDETSGETFRMRKLFVISSEEQKTCRKVRGQQLARAEAELETIAGRVGKRQLKTAAQVEARVAAVLEKRRVKKLYRVTVREEEGRLCLKWEVDAAAVKAAEALDGYYVLLCSLPEEQGESSALLQLWKREAVIERRFSDWKGPLKVRPVFVTGPKHMAALVLLLHLALMIYCLLEREARRRLEAVGQKKVERLLAGHVAAVPTGENILLAFEHLFLIVEEDEEGRHREMSELTGEQRQLWHLLGIGTPTFS